MKEEIIPFIKEQLDILNEQTTKSANGHDYELTSSQEMVPLDDGYYIGTWSGHMYMVEGLEIKLTSGIRGTSTDTKSFVRDNVLYILDDWKMTAESFKKYFESF